MNITNKENVPLPLAVWLANETYDLVPGEKVISATSLLKPLRQIILERRLPQNQTTDVMDRIASAYGSTLHAGIEQAWLNYNIDTTLRSLGIPDNRIKNLKINPEEPTKEDNRFDVWIEKRSSRTYNDWTISGKFDMVINGHLYDNKSTSVWTFLLGSRDADYRLQCSIYKWLNPDIIEGDTFSINYIFTDWSKTDSYKKKDYPKSRLIEKEYPFFEEQYVKNWIEWKLWGVNTYGNREQQFLPECSEEDLWRSPTKYKYYTSPDSAKAAKVFDDSGEAYIYLSQKGKGIIKEVKGEVKRCKYCSCWDICEQRRRYFEDDRFEFSKS